MHNADRVSIRNLICVEDPTLFSDTNRFRVEVIDLTHIRIYAWRVQNPLGDPDPDAGRHILSTGGVIVDMNSCVRMSIAVEHIL